VNPRISSRASYVVTSTNLEKTDLNPLLILLSWLAPNFKLVSLDDREG
jgi:hypothetical protein